MGERPAGEGRLRRGLRRLTASTGEMHAEHLRRDRDQAHDERQRSIEDAPERQPVVVSGVLRTVTLRPRGGVPALEAELYDGSAVLTLVFLGRRRITGIAPGRSLRAAGRIGRHEGVRVMYNPRYELLP